ncbi:MAG: PEGA domain-containing protein [Methanomicrobiales archaeon]|mgnify:CR=1 FL=1|nr:PEGA domain-containing protein [Methanomicrobiales archaeon]
MFKILALTVLILGIAAAGCSSPGPQQAADTPGPTQTSLYYYGNGSYNVNGTFQQVNGTLHISSMPPGADIYIDKELRCRSSCALSYVITPGHHTIEFRMEGYETVVYPVTVEKGGMEGINVTLEKKEGGLPVASATMGGGS